MYLLDVKEVQSLRFHKYQMSSDFNFAFYLPNSTQVNCSYCLPVLGGSGSGISMTKVPSGLAGEGGGAFSPSAFLFAGPFKTSHVGSVWEILSFSISS